MSKVIARKKLVNRSVEIGAVDRKAYRMVEGLEARIEAIQWLVPLGLETVAEELHRAVEKLAGRRYQRKGSHQPLRRWGCQPGSVFLGYQKVSRQRDGSPACAAIRPENSEGRLVVPDGGEKLAEAPIP